MKKFLIDKDWNLTNCDSDNPLAEDSIWILDKVKKISLRLAELSDLINNKLKHEAKNFEKLYKINTKLEIVCIVLVDIGSIEKCEKAGSFDKFNHVILENESLCLYEDIFTKIESIKDKINEEKTQTK